MLVRAREAFIRQENKALCPPGQPGRPTEFVMSAAVSVKNLTGGRKMEKPTQRDLEEEQSGGPVA
ncbi:hypothetical protein LCGC14_2381710 [marine sediment metagenome]|uniref:Uncharacterized protein n=1 Tax=marine sediment metagenome TaxID=412755 RepID=A0A0F9C0S0_9ZZZZ